MMRRANLSEEAAVALSDVPYDTKSDPCPCGSGRKYKTCHGRH